MTFNVSQVLTQAATPSASSEFPPVVLPLKAQSDQLNRSTSPQQQTSSLRPSLTPPSVTLSELRLIQVLGKLQKHGDAIMSNLQTRLTIHREEIHRLSGESIQRLRDAATHAQSSLFWSILQKAATCILSALSIVFGAALLGVGGGALVGGAMIASGILAIANFSMTEGGGWDWVAKMLAAEDQSLHNQLKWILPAAVGILSGAIGVVGSVGSALFGVVQFGEMVAFIAQAAFGLFSGMTLLGKGTADSYLIWTESDQARIQGDLTMEQQRVEHTFKDVEAWMMEMKAIKGLLNQTIKRVIESNLTINQFA
jgi:hypothetical protein